MASLCTCDYLADKTNHRAYVVAFSELVYGIYKPDILDGKLELGFEACHGYTKQQIDLFHFKHMVFLSFYGCQDMIDFSTVEKLVLFGHEAIKIRAFMRSQNQTVVELQKDPGFFKEMELLSFARLYDKAVEHTEALFNLFDAEEVLAIALGFADYKVVRERISIFASLDAQ